MKIGDLPPDQLHQRFGSYRTSREDRSFCIQAAYSPIDSFVEDFGFAYADFPVCDDSEISDFRVHLAPGTPVAAVA